MERNFLLPLLTTLLLTACIEIEDEIDKSVTITGSVIDLVTDAPPNDALISYTIGNEQSKQFEVEGGDFKLEGLPGSSDISLLIESASGAFMPREVYGRTYQTDSGVNFQNLSPIGVSPSITYSFSVLDIETKNAITDLIFTSSLNSSSYFNQMSYEFESSFDPSTGEYSVTVPEYFFSSMFVAELDINEDGKNEYQIYNNNYYCCSQIAVNVTTLEELDTFFLSKVTPTTNDLEQQLLKLRITVLDEDLNKIQGATLSVIDELNNDESVYDSASEQYTMELQVLDSLEINLPYFEVGEDAYKSNVIYVTVEDENTLTIENNSTGNYNYDRIYTVDNNADGIDIIVYTEKLNPAVDTNLSLLASSSSVDAEDHSFKLFFSVPIELIDNQIILRQTNGLSVVKGNDSSSDLVLPGSTSISTAYITTETELELSLNNTMLTIRPKDAITTKEDFTLYIYQVKEASTGVELGINETISFTTSYTFADTDLFDINSIVLDNNNYTTDGQSIVATNTANITASNSTSRSNYAYLYLPKEVYLLKELTLKRNILTKNGTSTTVADSVQTLVSNGVVNISPVYAISLASNENINSTNSYSYYGTSLSDGKYWRTSSYNNYTNDDQSSSENSSLYTYSYETLKGEIHTGTITLSVQ